jgi:transcriptional regulator with XRE-family HTH domain
MEIIKVLRKSKKETQQMLADTIGVSLRSIQHYESGKVTVPKEKLKAIADHYDVAISYLFKEVDKPLSNTIDKEIEELVKQCLEKWDHLIQHPYFETKIENLIVKRINQELEERLIEAERKKE